MRYYTVVLQLVYLFIVVDISVLICLVIATCIYAIEIVHAVGIRTFF